MRDRDVEEHVGQKLDACVCVLFPACGGPRGHGPVEHVRFFVALFFSMLNPLHTVSVCVVSPNKYPASCFLGA